MQKPEHLVQFDRLGDRLLRGGIAPRHVRRTLGELREHYDDAVRDEQGKGLSGVASAQAAWVRLGDEDHLARTILARPELHSVPARFPRLVFGGGPFLIWVAAIIFTVLGLVSLVELLESKGVLPPPGTPEPHWVYGPAYAACFFYARILPIVIGAMMMAGAIRQRLPLHWPIVGVTIVSLFGGTTDITVQFVTQVGEHGELSVDNYLIPLFTEPFTDAIGVFQPAEFMQGLAIGLLNLALILTPFMIWRKYNNRRTA